MGDTLIVGTGVVMGAAVDVGVFAVVVVCVVGPGGVGLGHM